MDKLDKNISIYTFEGLTERRGQDTYNIFEVDIEGINIKALGLYNGHGSKGKECSKYVSDAIEKLISENKNELKNLGSKGDSQEQITKIFVDGFKKIQNGMKDLENCPFELSGSTATIALIVNNKVCYIINIGDNIAIIGRKSNTKNEPIQLNKIHDVTENKDELERIKNNGGEVRCNNTFIDAVTILLL
jgi:serine/threonine protein phosphatase PrpC